MAMHRKKILVMICGAVLLQVGCLWVAPAGPDAASGESRYQSAQLVGRLEDDQLAECSGMDISTVTDQLFWAINDGHRSPFLFAVGARGARLGRIWVAAQRTATGRALTLSGGKTGR